MNAFRSFLYWLGRVLGDINAANKGRGGRRIGGRIAGKATGGAGWAGCSSKKQEAAL